MGSEVSLLLLVLFLSPFAVWLIVREHAKAQAAVAKENRASLEHVASQMSNAIGHVTELAAKLSERSAMIQGLPAHLANPETFAPGGASFRSLEQAAADRARADAEERAAALAEQRELLREAALYDRARDREMRREGE